MKNLLSTIKNIASTVFTVTDKGRIQQKEQLELKIGLTKALMDDLSAAGIEVLEVPKGFVIVIPNEEEGVIPIEVSMITKPLDYDYDLLHSEWQEKENKRVEKLAKIKE